MNIRLETPADYREVENLTREAFWNVYRPGCTEHYVLNQYRSNPDFVPELDFVMEEDGRIIGHVMFSRAELVLPDGSRKQSWTFGPVSIGPDYKRKGYGLKLLHYALEKARGMGVGFLCMEGNLDFYRHAGFDLASKLNIHYHAEPKDAVVPYFLAQELIPGWLQENGITEATYCPPKGYFVADENPEAFETYEATFPEKEKLRLPGQLGYENDVMETERIILRPWRDSDAEVLFKWASDPDVGPRAGWAPHKSVEESLEIIRTVFKDATNTWAIELKETGEAIGAMGYGPSCDCDLPARDGEPLVGYWVAKPYWNQGICTEALRLMLEHIRLETDIKSLISGHFIDNPASGRVMEKCGFVPTGETCVDPKQYQGENRPIRVLRLERDDLM
ncbi:MAG: GNAT family N-acetyltransferase [Bacteroidales bacterium]|nr:GNAT family N-acetyltransferase [Bacteroidales bacterium]